MVTFELSARFCIFNSVCVLEESLSGIVFGMSGASDAGRDGLREKLEKSAMAHFRRNGVFDGTVSFVEVSEDVVRKKAAIGYGKSDGGKACGSGGAASCGLAVKEREGDERDESVTVVLLDSILSAAVERGATDIHIEELRVRFRVCGLMEQYCELSSGRNGELVRRVKALSKLDLMDARRGQDGQFSFDSSIGGRDRRVSVRVSCVPCVSGGRSPQEAEPSFSSVALGEECAESVVLRLLDPGRVPLEIGSLGFSASQQNDIRMMASLEFGLVLVCGATGSGKSTTAAAMLSFVQKKSGGGRKIITIEDPPEYVLEGTTQIRVDARSGMDFAESLRFVFRQDPDVLFIGEVRDEETAKVCVRAALTGHLVLATMHASGVGESFSRLRGLGVSEEDVSACLRGVVFQRLSFARGLASIEADVRLL